MSKPIPQVARILKQYSAIQELLKPGIKNLDQERALKIRGHAFNLEELLRAYQKQHDKKLAPLFTLIKGLEDNFGQYIDGEEHLKRAKEMGISPKTIQFLEAEVEKRIETLQNFLKKNPIPANIEKTLYQIDWDGENNDRKFLLRHFQDLFEKIETFPYDLKETQGEYGLHQLRRDLRKTSILQLILNTDGSLILSDENFPKFEFLKKDKEFLNSKYGFLPNKVPAEYPILYPHTLYLVGAKQVQQLGTAKDILEARDEWLKESLEKSGEVAREKKETGKTYDRRLEEIVNQYIQKIPDWLGVDVEKIKEESSQILFKSSYLKSVRKNLKEQKSWSKKACKKAVEKISSPE